MKIKRRFLLAAVCVALAAGFIGGCKNDDDTDDTTPNPTPVEQGMTFTSAGSLIVHIDHKFKEQALQLAPQKYVTDANDTIKITEVAYYISNIILTTKQGTKVNLGNANLVQFVPPMVSEFTINNVPPGTYTNVSYLIGVDSIRNSTGQNVGDLDPNRGMYWPWNTGYIFVRLEGRYAEADTLAYTLDIGGTPNIMSASHSLTSYKKSGTSAKMHLKMDIARVFNTPNIYDLKTDSNHIHNPNSPAIQKLRPNISGAFSLTGLE